MRYQSLKANLCVACIETCPTKIHLSVKDSHNCPIMPLDLSDMDGLIPDSFLLLRFYRGILKNIQIINIKRSFNKFEKKEN